MKIHYATWDTWCGYPFFRPACNNNSNNLSDYLKEVTCKSCITIIVGRKKNEP